MVLVLRQSYVDVMGLVIEAKTYSNDQTQQKRKTCKR